ncbi:MAG: vWA domain-containing protein [Patescibacteria group bacterium]
MRETVMIRQSTADPDNPDKGTHAEAVAFVNKHRDFFEHYARGKVSFKPAPPGLETFAFDLNSNDIYINSVFYKKRGFSDEKTSFATCHEVEHFEEKKQLLAEKGGAKVFAKYIERIKDDKAFGLLDNCVADIRENRAVVSKTSDAFRELEQDLYRNDLFKDVDFTKEPKHIQFAQALLRESRVSSEKCTVAPEVREKIDGIYAKRGNDGTSLLGAMTHPDTPMSTRLKLQDKYLWPIVEELRKKDVEENKQKQQGQGQPKNEPQSGQGQLQEGGQGKKGRRGWLGKKKKEKTVPQPQVQKTPPESSAQVPKETDPNKIFADDYKKAQEKVMNAVPIEKQEEALKAWKEGDNLLENADQSYADKLGVKKHDLQNYRRIAESLNHITNPETNERVVEELRVLIERIIAKRLKPTPAPRYPLEEGEDLVDPAGLVADVKAGNLEPKVWETTETQERRGARFGEIEITLVFDRSGSMEHGGKLQEQRKAGVLVMEALKALNERADEERTRMDTSLEVRSEAYAFRASAGDGTPLKPMSKELSEKQRIDIATVLGSAPGTGTNDFTPLEAVAGSLTPEIGQKIADGELKKIIIVFTDGGSDSVSRVQTALKGLRSKSVVVIGIGVTESGAPALETYAPNAVLAPRAEDLPRVLADILKEHLADI